MNCCERLSPCKVNLLLNILGKRPDGFHELETIMCPIALHDRLEFHCTSGAKVELTCSRADLPVDSTNLVHRAAARFFERAHIQAGVRIHLEKRVPLAAGLGGGSSNAACTLLALHEMFQALEQTQLQEIAEGLGSDVPFFLQSAPALAIGRGERVTPLGDLAALKGAYVLLIHPGFGVATAWAYQALAEFPEAVNGHKGRAEQLIGLLRKPSLRDAGGELYNALEKPVLRKYPILALYQEFLRENGAAGVLMSGSGSTTFALFPNESEARDLAKRFQEHFGTSNWVAVAPI